MPERNREHLNRYRKVSNGGGQTGILTGNLRYCWLIIQDVLRILVNAGSWMKSVIV